MTGIVVLNSVFSPRPYDEGKLRTIRAWVEFFLQRDLEIVATPPYERRDVASQLPELIENRRVTFLPIVSFDTCDRWRAGLVKALPRSADRYVLWSSDFEFSQESQQGAESLLEHPGNEDLIVGTIKGEGTKQQIDDLATYPLLREVWFPEHEEGLQGFPKPRSELLRLTPPLLHAALGKRWYPTEQTIHLILQTLWDGFRSVALPLPRLADTEEERRTANVVQQVERMELWLSYMWRDRFPDRIRTEYLRKREQSFEVCQRACRLLLEV